MIEISPAILTNDEALVSKLLDTYEAFSVAQIDIDFVEEVFSGNTTVAVEKVVALLTRNPIKKKIGFHLMLEKPERAVRLITQTKEISEYMIYIHFESEHAFIFDQSLDLENFGLAFKLETKLPDLKVLAQFPEIQLMSIETGKQGNPFDEDVADKVAELRNMGYTGRVSLDGGVNLNTAPIIKDWPIDRVSVGSYLQKSKQPELDLMKLQLATNLRTE